MSHRLTGIVVNSRFLRGQNWTPPDDWRWEGKLDHSKLCYSMDSGDYNRLTGLLLPVETPLLTYFSRLCWINAVVFLRFRSPKKCTIWNSKLMSKWISFRMIYMTYYRAQIWNRNWLWNWWLVGQLVVLVDKGASQIINRREVTST